MHDIISLGCLGLQDREMRVLKSIFILSPELKEHYKLTDDSALHKADLVLINADSENAIRQWNKLIKINTLAKPLALSGQGRTIGDADSLRLPIRLPNLVEALKDVVKDTTHFEIPSDNTNGGPALRILIVDDSFPVRKYMEQKVADLLDIPAQISFAESGEEALVKCKGRSYDLVFLDVMMEGMDGYKVCKTIKSRYSSYVVMLTSKKSPFDKVRGTMSGCDAYITKPPEDKRLKEEIGKSLKYLAKHGKKNNEKLEQNILY